MSTAGHAVCYWLVEHPLGLGLIVIFPSSSRANPAMNIQLAHQAVSFGRYSFPICKVTTKILNNAKTMRKSCKNYRFPYIFAKTMNFGYMNYKFRELYQFGIRALLYKRRISRIKLNN